MLNDAHAEIEVYKTERKRTLSEDLGSYEQADRYIWGEA